MSERDYLVSKAAGISLVELSKALPSYLKGQMLRANKGGYVEVGSHGAKRIAAHRIGRENAGAVSDLARRNANLSDWQKMAKRPPGLQTAFNGGRKFIRTEVVPSVQRNTQGQADFAAAGIRRGQQVKADARRTGVIPVNYRI
jgi:hypothetical protein